MKRRVEREWEVVVRKEVKMKPLMLKSVETIQVERE
jgi:hypothetical protein